MPRFKRPNISYDAALAWAAAAYAQRVNGTYVKNIEMVLVNDQMVQKVPGQKTNRDLMKLALKDQTVITDEDRVAGEKIRTYYKGYAFKILQGKTLNDFDSSAMMIANREAITSMYDIAVMAYLPAGYQRGILRDQGNSRITHATGGFIGKPGDRVTLNIEVIRSLFSANYGVYFITGITPEDQVVFFSYKGPIEPGTKITITGGIKAHRDKSTQLNRVKVS